MELIRSDRYRAVGVQAMSHPDRAARQQSFAALCEPIGKEKARLAGWTYSDTVKKKL